MDRKDWVAPFLAATLGVLGTLGGCWLSGYQHERAAQRHAQVAAAKQVAAERAAELKALKEAGLRYMGATDALVNALAFGSPRDKALVEHLTHVQSAGNEVVLIADEELARQTVALNQHMASLLTPSSKPMEQRLAELNALLVDWIKQLRRGIDSLKTQNEDSLGLKASTQVVAQLKR
jgi:hypothetical protein